MAFPPWSLIGSAGLPAPRRDGADDDNQIRACSGEHVPIQAPAA